MPQATFSVSAANFAVGNDIFTVGTGLGVKQAMNGNGLPRKLMKVGVAGSTNAGDCGFDLYAGGKYLGSFMNTTGGANVIPKESQDLIELSGGDVIGPSVTLSGIVNDAAAANPVTVTLIWEDKPLVGGYRSDKVVMSGGGGFRRGGYGGGGYGGGGFRRRSSGGYRRRRSY